jgi:hypothetical protein
MVTLGPLYTEFTRKMIEHIRMYFFIFFCIVKYSLLSSKELLLSKSFFHFTFPLIRKSYSLLPMKKILQVCQDCDGVGIAINRRSEEFEQCGPCNGKGYSVSYSFCSRFSPTASLDLERDTGDQRSEQPAALIMRDDLDTHHAKHLQVSSNNVLVCPHQPSPLVPH